MSDPFDPFDTAEVTPAAYKGRQDGRSVREVEDHAVGHTGKTSSPLRDAAAPSPTSRPSPPSRPASIWARPGRVTKEHHADVLAAFRNRTAARKAMSVPPPLNLPPRPPHLDVQLAQANGHLDRIVKLRENREAKARGEERPHRMPRLKREPADTGATSVTPVSDPFADEPVMMGGYHDFVESER